MMSAAVKQSEASQPRSPPCWISSLPDEMALNCLARVSRLDQAAISMTSKSYRSLVASPEWYETRSRIGCTEECIYVCINFPLELHPSQRWFILRRGKGNSFGNRLIPIPSFPTPRDASMVALGGGIYVIGGKINYVRTSQVSFLDCRTHTWSYVPSMRVARFKPTVGVLDGKIYVFGGYDYKKEDPSNWAEIFDPKMQTWSRLVIPDLELNRGSEACRVSDRETEFYNFRSEEGMWNDLRCCKIDRLLYCLNRSGYIMWCDPWCGGSGVSQGRMYWRKVYGMDHMQRIWDWDLGYAAYPGDMADVWHCHMLNRGYKNGLSDLIPGSRLSKSGDNVVIFWDKLLRDEDSQRLDIWCAEISLEKREGGQIWGAVLWSDLVYSLNPFQRVATALYSVSVNV